MNPQLKTILLTVLTLSVFVIALVELSGVSRTALVNKYSGEHSHTAAAEAQAAVMPKTTIAFTDTRHDFGTITEGEIVRHAFHFKNTGEHPLLISKAEASCGCTVPEWPKEPVPPGGEGDIVVQFNSKNRAGHQQKNVLIHSNAQQEAMSIGFTAEVKEK